MTSPLLSLPFLFLTACSSQEANPHDKIVVISGGGHSASSEADFHQHSFPCCTDSATTAVVRAYTEAMDALASDDLAASRAAAARLLTAAEALAAQEAASPEARTHAQQVHTLVAPWASDDLAGIRADLTLLAAELLPLARSARLTASAEDALTVSIAFCPMAPGRWLQARPQLRNPYFGAQMLTCGVFEP